MSTMRLSTWMTLPWIPRRVLRNVAVIILVPVSLLMAAVYLSREPAKPTDLKVAALALAQDIQNSPLKGGWTVSNIRVNDKMRVEMDVEVAYYHQAEVIKSRSGRVKYSYLKLACPAATASVYSHLKKLETVWIHLYFNHDLIVSGACPKTNGPFG